MINDKEGMDNAHREKDNNSYWGDWTDEDPYSNVDSAEEMEEEANGVSEEGWDNDYYLTFDYNDGDWRDDYDDE